MTITFQLSPAAAELRTEVSEYAQQRAAREAWPAGVCEMAAGAAVLSAALASRGLQLGVDLLLQPLAPAARPLVQDEAACAVLGLLPLLVLEQTGIADAGPALLVPALALAAGGAVLLGLGGCAPGVQTRQFLADVPRGSAALAAGASLAAGIALLVQGAQRLSPGGSDRGARAWYEADRLTLHRLSASHAMATWTGLASYTDALGPLAAPWVDTSATLRLPALGSAALGDEARCILQAVQRRPAQRGAVRRFELPRQVGAKAD